ncbi:extracellular matrix organizing protein FRAS1-like [Amphiura filiformis]|uniref:extracellular matrix organizing protein FRAS1-like n=1 Tax=Amphiura filiformis TaxID=82378 RepID=UPI003B20BFC2
MLGHNNLILLCIFTLILHDVYTVAQPPTEESTTEELVMSTTEESTTETVKITSTDITYKCVDIAAGTTSMPDLLTGCTFSENDEYAVIEITITQGTGAGDIGFEAVYTGDDTDTATAGEDYNRLDSTIPIPNTGDVTFTKNIYIPIIDDKVIEDTESFTVTGEAIVNSNGMAEACVAPACSLNIQITDNDVPCVSFDKSNYFVTGDGATTTPIGFVIPNDPAMMMSPVSVAFSTAGITAITDTDYTIDASPVTVTAPAGMISVTATCDLVEGMKAFEISIDEMIGTYTLGTPSTATVWILDCPATPAATPESEFCLNSTFYPVMESSSAVKIWICRKMDVSQEGSVVLMTSNVDAIAPSDYIVINQRVSFAPDEICTTREITIVNDERLEPTECFQVSLSQPIGGVICAQSSATVNIIDDDYCFTLESRYYSVPESDEPFILGILKMGYLGDPSTIVYFQTIEGSAKENQDYTRATLSLDFPLDNAIMNVPGLTVYTDDEYETQEQFTVRISAAIPSRICEPSTATVVIVSSDPLCNPVCLNNGFCTALNTCACPPGFTGTNCEQTECTTACQNSGVCAGPNMCMCPAEYTGPTCETVRCPINYCLNGGRCLSGDDKYECECSDERFEGIRCETRVTTGLPGGAIAGIVVGVIVGLCTLGIVLCVIYLFLRPRPSVPPARVGLQPDTPVTNAFGTSFMLTDGTTSQYLNQPTEFLTDIFY